MDKMLFPADVRQEMHIKIKETETENTVSGNVLYFYVKNAT